eukprot:3932219-Rhodomonas_salina.1
MFDPATTDEAPTEHQVELPRPVRSTLRGWGLRDPRSNWAPVNDVLSAHQLEQAAEDVLPHTTRVDDGEEAESMLQAYSTATGTAVVVVDFDGSWVVHKPQNPGPIILVLVQRRLYGSQMTYYSRVPTTTPTLALRTVVHEAACTTPQRGRWESTFGSTFGGWLRRAAAAL